MPLRFEELDFQPTPMGEISLRRRYDPAAEVDVYEVRLGDEYLMSSLFTVAERELATLALGRSEAPEGASLDVLVGGLGLGYTALAALEDPRVGEVTVVEYSGPVLDWHRRALLPDAAGLATDPRCRFVQGDFFARVRQEPERRHDLILLDIDHSPRHVLHPSHAAFYDAAGLRAMARHLTDAGVFALWSDDPPDAAFEAELDRAFADHSSHPVDFANPITGGRSSNTVYVARGVL
ncbi:spermidine synthase [Isoptericola halotolerans]|uniref:Spermidine synthase n=1 Tax=Isoptericola halotolerans TaxID=300560 RepID=A0ABX2A6N6_9MICO|nr:spermidine synthase [Isoptericola halotolerans]NOV98483.1 spermidine synthase [Isoptericola halotolerans]